MNLQQLKEKFNGKVGFDTRNNIPSVICDAFFLCIREDRGLFSHAKVQPLNGYKMYDCPLNEFEVVDNIDTLLLDKTLRWD